MNDNSMVERWNEIDSAKMAVSVESVLYRILNNKKLPFDFDEALENGIAFLEEAKNGGAIICGTPETSEFTGTLSPLKISLRRFETTRIDAEKEMEFYESVVSKLKEYKSLLETVREQKEIPKKARNIAEAAHDFFYTLSNELIKQTDPTSKAYSHQLL